MEVVDHKHQRPVSPPKAPFQSMPPGLLQKQLVDTLPELEPSMLATDTAASQWPATRQVPATCCNHQQGSFSIKTTTKNYRGRSQHSALTGWKSKLAIFIHHWAHWVPRRPRLAGTNPNKQVSRVKTMPGQSGQFAPRPVCIGLLVRTKESWFRS